MAKTPPSTPMVSPSKPEHTRLEDPMVAAVFHAPLDMPPVAAPSPSPVATAPKARPTRDFKGFWLAVIPPVLGLAVLVLIWQAIASAGNSGIPKPAATWAQAVKLFSDPFYSNGPNDQGIGWNILSSLKRVAGGFGLAALAGIPA